MSGNTAIIACSVISLELERVIGDRPMDLHLLEQGLHATPKIMPERIMAKVREIAIQKPSRILLGYGLCSNGILGVGGGHCPLVSPRCHDCIAMLLGSVKRYNEIFRQRPGAYYLSAGWVKEGDDPLSCVEIKYTPRVGEKKALRAMTMELANYTHICYINNGVGDQEKVKARTRENCRVFNKEYMELPGSLDYFKALLDGPRTEEEFVELAPGEVLSESMFYPGM